RLLIANRYDSACIFCEGMAAIKLIGMWGLINIDERLVIQPFYASVSDFSNGLAIVSNGMYGLIDKQGKHRFELEYSKIIRTSAGTYIMADKRGQQGLASAEGRLILSPFYEQLDDIGTGLIVATRNNKKGIYDHSGKLLASFVHDEVVSLPSYVLIR
ncbi:MAG: WG repeat-containing protein, partial [Bacteroidota bacterium]